MTLQNKRKAREAISKHVLFADNNCFQLQLTAVIDHIVLVFCLREGVGVGGRKNQEVLFPVSLEKLANTTLKTVLKVLKLAVCLFLK